MTFVPFVLPDQDDGSQDNLRKNGVNVRWNNLRSDGTPGYEVDNLPLATTVQAAYVPLATAQANALLRLRSEALAKMQGGHQTGSGITVPTDAFSLQLMSFCNTVASNNPAATFNLPDAAGIFHQLTAAQMLNVWSGVVAFQKSCLDNWQTLAAQINALTDWNAARLFDVTAGWPA